MRPSRFVSFLRSENFVVCTVLFSCAAFLACVVQAIAAPAELSATLRTTLERVRGNYIAEDIFRRSLHRIDELRAGARIVLEEGELSRYPDREAWVELRVTADSRHLVCGLTRRVQTLHYRSRTARGRLPTEFTLPLAQLDPVALDSGVIFESPNGHSESCSEPERLEEPPLRSEESWTQVDFVVDADSMTDHIGGVHTLNLSNFQVADALALRQLERPTGLPNYEVGHAHGDRLVASFRSPRDLVVRVRGHLWLGRPNRKLLVGTGGRTLVVFVDGNVRIRGTVELLGEADRLYVVAGRPGYAAFRDHNGNGVQDEGEERLPAHVDRPVLAPVEGGGLIYVGDAESRPVVQAALIASQDLVVASAGAELRGSVLCRRLLRVGEHPGALVFHEQARTALTTVPIRGLPVVAGTENLERVQPPFFWKARRNRPAPGESEVAAPSRD